VVSAEGISSDENVAKISVVGLGMAKQTGVAEKMFRALADAGINIQMITTSEIKISVLVSRERSQEALRIVHRVFELDRPDSTPHTPREERITRSRPAERVPRPTMDAAAVV